MTCHGTKLGEKIAHLLYLTMERNRETLIKNINKKTG